MRLSNVRFGFPNISELTQTGAVELKSVLRRGQVTSRSEPASFARGSSPNDVADEKSCLIRERNCRTSHGTLTQQGPGDPPRKKTRGRGWRTLGGARPLPFLQETRLWPRNVREVGTKARHERNSLTISFGFSEPMLLSLELQESDGETVELRRGLSICWCCCCCCCC